MKTVANKTLLIPSLIALLLLSPTSRSSPFSIGGTTLEIPSPPSFEPVTSEMPTLFQLLQHLVPPTNEQLVSYIAESEIPKVLNDEVPNLTRRLSVQTLKSGIGLSMSKSDFSEIKQAIKKQTAGLLRDIEEAFPGMVENMNKGITEELGADFAISVSQVVPLPPHEETDRTLAYSAFSKVSGRDQAGNPISEVVAGTSTLVHVQGKVLFLYSHAEESGLEWSREISKQWADSILAANPSDLMQRVNESVPPVARAIDWGKVVGMVITATFIGSLVAVIGWAKRRGKAE